MFALNQGEVWTCPGRALVHEPIYDHFMEKAVARFEAMIQGNPPDPAGHGWRPQQDACVQ